MRLRTLATFVVFVLVSALVPFESRALNFADILPAGSNVTVESLVRSTFADTPVMIAIAQCESGFRQFAPDGQVLRGPGGYAIGVYQLSETGHTAKALSMGLDIKTIEGNVAFAKYLYQQQGITPWMAAFPCFNAIAPAVPNSGAVSNLAPSSPDSSAPPAASPLLTTDLSFGMDHPEVKTLQQLLNAIGYPVALQGLGSKGNEITNFGTLTRAAVRKFQCAENIVCSGDEHTSGFGFVNAATRQVLLARMPAGFIVPATVANGTTPVANPTTDTAAPAVPFPMYRNLEMGMKGEDVRYLQGFLKEQQLFMQEPTGTFGPVTKASVIAFQQKQHIVPVSGYVGPKTQAAIRQVLGL